MSEISILAIVFAGIASGVLVCVLGMRYAEREHIRKLQAKGALQDSSTMRVEFERLVARVEVLERIITDSDRRLAGEIDSLRRAQGASSQAG